MTFEERKTKTCQRCSGVKDLESHHIIYKDDGGDDDDSNKVVLCLACHDYRHAKETVEAQIKVENQSDRLVVLQKRLEIIETENTPEKIRVRGYTPYFRIYSVRLPGRRKQPARETVAQKQLGFGIIDCLMGQF